MEFKLKIATEKDAAFAEIISEMYAQSSKERGTGIAVRKPEYIAEKMTPQIERSGFGNYVVVRKEDGVKMGACGLYDRKGLEGIDIGFAFLPQYEKMGYAYEAALKIKEAAIEHFGIKRIKAITTKDNLASQKLLEKLDLKFKEFIQLEGDEEELMLYEFVTA